MKNLRGEILNLFFPSSERRFIICVLLTTFIIKIILAYIFIKYPDTPHDFYAYIDSANLLLEGKALYLVPISNGKIFIYPPFFPTLMAGWIAIFGTNYFLLKFPSIIFSSLTIIVFFYLLKRISDIQRAKYLTIIFSFSYITLFGPGFWGNDDDVFIFFMITSIYLLLTKRYKLSAITLAISILFKQVPIILFPGIIIYLYRILGIRQIVKYIFVWTITFLILLFPFYLNSGLSVLYPYTGATNFRSHIPSVGFFSPLNLIKTGIGIYQNAIHYFSTHTMIPYDQNPLKSAVMCPLNILFNKIATFYGILGLIFMFIYILKFRIKDEKLEITRNLFLFTFGSLLFSKAFVPIYFQWFFPFFLILLSLKEKENFKNCILTKKELTGILLVFVSLLIQSVILIHCSSQTQGKVFLSLCCFLGGIGTYLMFFRVSFRKIWAIIVFLHILSDIGGAINPLLIFKPILVKFIPDIPIGPYETYLSYATLFTLSFVIILMTIIAMICFFIKIHKYLKDDYYSAMSKQF
ncbi:MAG: glycosyltransferase family 39 protein [bacterium]